MHHVYSALGKSHIKEKSNLIGDKDLVILNVEERDAGKFTCKADGRSSEQTLTVVSGESQT